MHEIDLNVKRSALGDDEEKEVEMVVFFNFFWVGKCVKKNL